MGEKGLEREGESTVSEMAIVAPPAELPEFARTAINLADSRLGAVAVRASDEFFGPLERMLNPEPAVYYPDRYDDNGKWMDGWETRRRRNTCHDVAVVRLALPGTIAGLDIDTSFFTGNYAPAASIEACYAAGADPGDDADWIEILPATSLNGDSHHFLAIADSGVWTHLRVHMYPDGGIARLRAYGRPRVDWSDRDPSRLHDLAAVGNGGRFISCSDAHYGSPLNLLRPGRGVNMRDGWETRRRREPGNDWCVLALGHAGMIRRVEVDTAHFKGNYPDRCSIQAANVERGTDQSLTTQSMFWETLLPEQKLEADAVHTFEEAVRDLGPVTHVRFNIIPDGGASRLRLWGNVGRDEEG